MSTMPHLGRFASVIVIGAALLIVAHVQAGELSRLDLGGPWQVVQEGSGEAIPATVPGYDPHRPAGRRQDPRPVLPGQREGRAVGGRSELDLSPHVRGPAGPAGAASTSCFAARGWTPWPPSGSTASPVAQTDNMFRTYEFDVKKLAAGRAPTRSRSSSIRCSP